MIFILLGFFGILAGISASLFGFGGGLIVVPLLYHLLGTDNPMNMHIAVATSTSIIIVNSLNSTYKHYKMGNIMWNMVFPLIIYIAIGAILGVYCSKFMSSAVIRWCFITYLIYIILKYVTKKNSGGQSVEIKSINKYVSIIIGLVIGGVSAMLGVGGSVMTVPLMSKLGVKMRNAVAIANPLSFPVGLIGAIGYVILSFSQNIHLGSQYLGYIYLPALFFLVVGGLIGVPIGSKLVSKIPDKLHKKSYMLLLLIVLIAMLL